jgi:hypothetical protein
MDKFGMVLNVVILLNYSYSPLFSHFFIGLKNNKQQCKQPMKTKRRLKKTDIPEKRGLI